MTIKKKLPNLRDTGLFKVYLKFCTPAERKALGAYKKPQAQKWSEYTPPIGKINELLDAGIAPANIPRYVGTSRRIVERVLEERAKKEKKEEEKK